MFKRLTAVCKRIFTKKSHQGESDILDKKLVMSLKRSKVPTWPQLKKISSLLSTGEKQMILLFIVIILLSFSIYGYLFYQNNIITIPSKQGLWSEALIGQPKFINPILAQTNDTDLDLSGLIYSGLLKFNEHLELVPDLAETYQISEDQKIYTFVLKENLVWQDGEPITADDIIFTFQAIQDPEWQSPLLISFKGITIDKIDKRSISFNLPGPFAPFLPLLTTGILPKHIWQEIPPASARLAEFNLKPIGSAEWQFKEFTKDKLGNIHTYRLEPNEHYHGKGSNISEIIFKFFPDFESAIYALNDRQVMGLSFLPAELKGLINEPVKYNFNKIELPQYTALFFNTKNNDYLKELAVRKALAYAIDKEGLLKSVLTDVARIIYSPILSNQPGFLDTLETYDFNPAMSQELLTEAEWELITEEEGKKWQKEENILNITITTVNHPENIKIAQKIKDYWEAIGIKTKLAIIDPANIQIDVIKGRNFEVLLYGEIIGADPDPYPFWHSSQAEHPGLNLSQFKDAKTDTLLEEARQTNDPKARIANYETFQKILAESVPAIFLYSPTYTYVQDKRLRGFAVDKLIIPADRFNNIDNWYTKTKKVLK